MAKTTTNYGLTKPEKSDNYSVDVMAGNMDIIDSKLKNLDTTVTSQGTTLSGHTTTLSGYGPRITAVEDKICTTISYSGTVTINLPLHSSPSSSSRAGGFLPLYCSSIPVTGKISAKFTCASGYSSWAKLLYLNSSGVTTQALTSAQKEYTISNATNIWFSYMVIESGSITIGKPVYS